MEKVKEYLNTFLKIWAVPRYRALIMLFGYIVFFALVISGIRANQSNITKPPATEPIANDLIKVNEFFDSAITVNGKVYDHLKTKDVELLKVDDKYYSVFFNILTLYDMENKKELDEEGPQFTIKFWRFNPTIINNLIKDSKLEYETKFSEGGSEKGYIVPMRKVFENINASLSLREGMDINDSSIKLSVKEKNKEVEAVVLNLTDYQKMFIETEEELIVKIEYK